MEKLETIEDFYNRNCYWAPDSLSKDIGHFNIFKLEAVPGCNVKVTPYRRRDFHKISLIFGRINVRYADKIIEVKKQALIFSNPQIPYNWEYLEKEFEGFFCIFTQAFFNKFGSLSQYSVFQPNGTPVFELDDNQALEFKKIYERMSEEISSDYAYKYDELRMLVFELVHGAMKIEPSANFINQKFDAPQRIASLFMELLERQFPIDEAHQKVGLRSASEYANQLNIHVNHLNRTIKEVTGKTTSQLIAERLLLESKILLKQTIWSVAEIAFALGFAEATHFNNFFKKYTNTTPLQFRNV